MVVRELLARMGIQVDQGSVSRAEAAIGKVKKGLVALAAGYGVKKAYDFVQGTFENIAQGAADLQHLAEKTGSAVGELQELQYAAKMADVDAGSLSMALVHLSRSADEAATIGGASGFAFARLGISVKNASGKLKPTSQLLSELADKFQAMPNGPEKAALAMQLLSRSGAEMIPLLNQGSAGIAKYSKEAHKAGAVMSDSMVRQGAALDDGIKRLHASITGLTYAVFGPFVGSMTKGKESFAAWIDQHRKWIALRVHDAVTALGNAVKFTMEMAQKFPVAFAAVAVAVGLVVAPLTTLIGLFGLLADDVFTFFQHNGGRSVTGLLVKAFKVLSSYVSDLGFFGGLHKGAEEFADWFAHTLVDAIGRTTLDKFFGGPMPNTAAPGYNPPFPSADRGFRNILSHLGFPSPPSGYDSSFAASHGIGGGAFSPTINITAPSGDAQDLSDATRAVLQDLWDTNMRAAAPAGR